MDENAILTWVLVVVAGSIVGSFLNVCIVRIPAGESIVHPPSHCPICKTPIRFYDNLPIVGYLLLLGRCRWCKTAISLRYPFVECLTGAMAGALYGQFGLSVAFASAFVFVATLIVVSVIDINVRIVPDVLSLPGIIIGLAFSMLARYVFADSTELVPTPVNAILGVISGGGFLLGVAWIYERVTGVDGMGGGDIKLLAMIGAFLGWQSIPFTIFFASIAGSIIGLGVMFATGAGRRLALPFAPFLCLGATVHLFFGRELIQLYFN